MFFSLLLVTFLIALMVSSLLAFWFRPAFGTIMRRILSDAIFEGWVRYLTFVIYVVGISSGVRIWELERYVNPRLLGETRQEPLVLTAERWVLEVYRTVIGTLQGVAWVLLVFFVFSLFAFVIVRLGEMKYQGSSPQKEDSAERKP